MAAWEESFETYAGTRLFICAARPATNTEVAWEAIDTWHEITITSVPSVQGRAYNTSSLSVVSTGRDAEAKGSYTFGTTEFGVQWLPEQPGQVIALAASLNNSIPGFVLVSPEGAGVSYFSGQVMTFTDTGGGSNDAKAGTLAILRQGGDTLNATTPTVPTEDLTP